MSTQDEQPVERGTGEFRDSGLDQDHVADAFESMQAAPGGGALLEGETAETTGGEEERAGDADGGADVASGGGEGEREATTGAVGEREGEDSDADDR
ncbi:hypothetical protein [Ornithinimicrobium avium]|uniref:Uncharacterized protein n=1 Tax=Ornithinimicrobium avium TaxID=2283195 RepID=A0A345NLH8_9MICO|nr:hypothetical protein [Ornithinimicrobium avium]AXH95886.1 hypothetical protein DV701_06870 [Ornithinimicrobium avium]